jgi:hypothetical protein
MNLTNYRGTNRPDPDIDHPIRRYGRRVEPVSSGMC